MKVLTKRFVSFEFCFEDLAANGNILERGSWKLEGRINNLFRAMAERTCNICAD